MKDLIVVCLARRECFLMRTNDQATCNVRMRRRKFGSEVRGSSSYTDLFSTRSSYTCVVRMQEGDVELVS